MSAYRSGIAASIMCIVVLAIIFCSSSYGQEGRKVAVLYFTDHSKFDSGGGCLSIWPLNVIFGSGQKREKWDLKSGFRDMLNEKLTEAGYTIVEPGYVDETLQDTGQQNMSAIASRLEADIIIVGDIRKFEQHRTRASSQGPTTISAGEDTRLVAMGGVGGFFYSSTVNTVIRIYDNSGDEMESGEVNSRKNLRDFYMGVGLLTYHKGDTGEKKEDQEPQDPIVDYKKLDKMKFGSDEFKNRTLFGMTTMDVMSQIVGKVSGYLKPAELSTVEGKIIYVGTGERLKENEVYINLGISDGVGPGQRLSVFAGGLQLTDPDTGEELGTVPEEKVGVIRISRIEADHLSIAEILEKTGQIERGNIIRRE